MGKKRRERRKAGGVLLALGQFADCSVNYADFGIGMIE